MNANFSASRVVPNVIARKKPRYPTTKRNESNRKQNNKNHTRRGKGSLGLGMNRLHSNANNRQDGNQMQSRRGKGSLGLGMEQLFAGAPSNMHGNQTRGKGYMSKKNHKRLQMLGIPLISNNGNRNQGNGNGNQGNGNGNQGNGNGNQGNGNGNQGNGRHGVGKNIKKLGVPLIPNNSNSNNENNQEYNENQENNQENNDESYAETIRMAIVRAIAKNENETLSYFLETYPDYVDLTNDAGETALFYAVTRNNEDAVNILLMNGADIDHQNNQDETALFIAAQENNAQMVDLLLSLGADPDIESEFGEKPINIAASQGYAKLIPKFPRLPMPKDVHIRLALDDSDMAQYIPDGIFESITDSVYYAAKDVMANPNLCVGIGAVFKEGSYENATHLIIVEDNEGTVLGASSLQVNFDNDWFEIDLFCSDYRYKGVGSYMMDAIKKLKTHWDRKIKLKSVNDAHNFYIKQGFTNNAEPKTANGLTKMTYS